MQMRSVRPVAPLGASQNCGDRVCPRLRRAHEGARLRRRGLLRCRCALARQTAALSCDTARARLSRKGTRVVHGAWPQRTAGRARGGKASLPTCLLENCARAKDVGESGCGRGVRSGRLAAHGMMREGLLLGARLCHQETPGCDRVRVHRGNTRRQKHLPPRTGQASG